MFGHENTLDDLAEFLLSQFSLDEILEMNDLTDEEVLLHLLQNGLIGEPEHVLKVYEED